LTTNVWIERLFDRNFRAHRPLLSHTEIERSLQSIPDELTFPSRLPREPRSSDASQTLSVGRSSSPSIPPSPQSGPVRLRTPWFSGSFSTSHLLSLKPARLVAGPPRSFGSAVFSGRTHPAIPPPLPSRPARAPGLLGGLAPRREPQRISRSDEGRPPFDRPLCRSSFLRPATQVAAAAVEC